MYTGGPKVETKLASEYLCDYVTRGYRLKDGCSVLGAEIQAINDKALRHMKRSWV